MMRGELHAPGLICSHDVLIVPQVHLWPSRFPISFSHFKSGSVISPRRAAGGSAGGGGRRLDPPPPEKALRVLKSPEGLHGTCHQLCRYNAGGGRKQTRCLPPLIERAPIGPGATAAAQRPVSIQFILHLWGPGNCVAPYFASI